MKYKYRGQLNNGKMVDIFHFEGENAICDGEYKEMHIDEFNTIFLPRETFKKEILKLKEVKVEKVIKEKVEIKKDIKKS